MVNMPQDSFRSAVYRSFVKCDDPKGVAECKTMRKSKIITNDLNPSPHQSTGKGNNIDFKTLLKEESVKGSSSHLTEVSKGAQKLNLVIDTYSNGMRFDRHSTEIAKDLLKGALDLQESLMVFGKTQEASHYMSNHRKKPKEKTKDDKSEERKQMERSKSDRYADYKYQAGFQKTRFSVDGSSRDCYDELRTMIIDGLARQNLLPPNFHEKPNCYEGKRLDSMVDIPSTSSTQSSATNFISFTSSDTSFSSDSTKRSKGSNLITKLMGLEEIPSQQGFISSPKRFEIETISGTRRPTFEIDVEKAKKPQFGAYKEDMEEKKLRNIIESMRYKGLLKGNSSEGLRGQSSYFDSNNSRSVIFEDAPHIVIMKPMDMSRVEPDMSRVDLQKLVRKSGKKDMNKGPVDFDEVGRRLRGDKTPVRKQGFREFKEKELLSSKLKASGSVDQKEKKKRLERMENAREPKKKLGQMENMKSVTVSTSHDQAKVNSMKERKNESEPTSRRRSVSPQKSNPPMVITSHDQAKVNSMKESKNESEPTSISRSVSPQKSNPQMVVTSHDQAKVNSMKERKNESEPTSRRRSVSPQKSNPPMVITSHDQAKVNSMKESKNESEPTSRSRSVSPQKSNPQMVVTSHDQAKVNSMKERKNESEPTSRRRSVSPQKSNPPMVVSRNKPPLSRNGGDRKKNQKLDKESFADPIVEEDVEHKHGESQIDQSCEGEHALGTSSTTATQHLAEEETVIRVDQIKVQLENDIPETDEEVILETDEEAGSLNSHNSIREDRCFEKQTKVQKLFLSSPMFLNYAEELFEIKTDSQSVLPHHMSLDVPELVDTRLLLDVANELMLRKITQTARPRFLTPSKGLKISLSLTQLVDEMCKGVEDLEFSKYNEKGHEKLITEIIFSVLEKDMSGTGLTNGAWELGWRHGYCFNEVEKVVGDIENRVFNELIEGMLIDFAQVAF